MFERSDTPRIFGLPPGVDFPHALVAGLIKRLEDQPPQALARVQIIVNTKRMARRVRDLFDQGPARLLPRIGLVTDLGESWGLAQIADPVPPLRRRLELAQLVAGLLEAQPDLAPRSSLFDLSESLAHLMDEMHGEGVAPAAIEALDVSDQSGHWARTQAFLRILGPYFDANVNAPDVEARQRLMVEQITDRWQRHPPTDPVIIAGSTGSRGATQMLMRRVAGLPQGAVLLPGYDFDMPGHGWEALDDKLSSEDHPQYRFHDLLSQMSLTHEDVKKWDETPPANAARNKVISLSLRPAPVTDQWLEEGPKLQDEVDIGAAMAGATLLEAPSPRMEAMAIAMRLRKAAQEGQTAALITPDRVLTRQVAAALDRWDILPDDSAGIPLHLSVPGRFLRHVAELFGDDLGADALLTLLKHPLTNQGQERGEHSRLTQELELHLRRKGVAHPGADHIQAWAAGRKESYAQDWADWICACFMGQHRTGDTPLEQLAEAHLTLAERIARGHMGAAKMELWQHDAGREARKAMDVMLRDASAGGAMRAMDYCALLHRVLAGEQVRNPIEPHPGVLIWGTLEARVHGADLLILAGLNEGTWPEAPAPDPWLNRALRVQAGLLLPERRIGLSAHDYQQAAAAPEVWMTRSIRSDDAETVASRWLNRLQNLLAGLPQGAPALADMRKRGAHWLAMVAALEEPGEVAPALRPAPCPPTAARPDELPVTAIKKLIRDPYTIYVRYILNLRPLDPLMRQPDALLRGIAVHKVMEEFTRMTLGQEDFGTAEQLNQIARDVLTGAVPWPEARALWQARIARIATPFLESEAQRRRLARPAKVEVKGKATLDDPPFTLTATADRIDVDANGALSIYDYKTGDPPSVKQQKIFDMQLLLEAAIAEQSGYGDMGPGVMARALYLGLGNTPKEVPAPLDTETPDKVWREFRQLIGAWMNADKGYVARRSLHEMDDISDYDQLARFGEWDITASPAKIKVGR